MFSKPKQTSYDLGAREQWEVRLSKNEASQ